MNVARSIPHPRTVVPIAIAVIVIATLALTLQAPGGGRSIAPARGTSSPRVSPTIEPAPQSNDAERAGGGGAIGAMTEQPRAGAAMSTADAKLAPSDEPMPESATSSGSLPTPSIDQRIARTASIQLLVKHRSFEDAWGDTQAVARTFGGYVVSSSRSGSGASARTAAISLRVPSSRFDAAVAELRHVTGAKVERLDVSSEDVSQEYVDTASRLRHDRAVEARLLTLLAATKTVSEVLAVQARLDNVQAAIEVSTGRIKYLDSVTSMSTIDVTLRVPPAAGQPTHADHSQLGQALRGAGDRFVARISSGIIWVGGALPMLMLLGFILLVARFSVRRYRGR